MWRRGARPVRSPRFPDERQGRQGCHAAPLQQDPQPISSAGIIASLVHSSCQSWLKPTFPVQTSMLAKKNDTIQVCLVGIMKSQS